MREKKFSANKLRISHLIEKLTIKPLTPKSKIWESCYLNSSFNAFSRDFLRFSAFFRSFYWSCEGWA